MRAAIVATAKTGEIRERLSKLGFRVLEARTTQGIQEALPQVSLVIMDESWVEESGLSFEGLEEALRRGGVLVVTPEEFLARPEEVTERALKLRKTKAPFFPTKLTLGFTSLSGGVGCTMLALEFARTSARFVPTAIIEVPWGEGALRSRLSLPDDHPDLYQVAMGLREPQSADQLTAIPTTRATQRLLLGSPEKLKGLIDSLLSKHVVVVVDGHYAHPLFQAIIEKLGTIAIVADPRPETIANAEIVAGEVKPKGIIVVNKANLATKLALRGKAQLFIDEGEKKIGEKIGAFIYGGKK
jgi:hypothetical protein